MNTKEKYESLILGTIDGTHVFFMKLFHESCFRNFSSDKSDNGVGRADSFLFAVICTSVDL